MKRIFLSVLAMATLFALQGAGTPAANAAGAQKVAWNLSGSVMPVPPYGSLDSTVSGAPASSKLIVNMPNGAVGVGLTGAMNGLQPNTQYTVYVGNGYTPYVSTGWNVTGNWDIALNYNGTDYTHDMTLTQTGSSLTGSGGYPAGGPHVYEWSITSGTVSGNSISFTANYTAGADALTPLTTMHVTGTIASNGTMSGTWDDNYQGGSRTGTWSTTSGHAVMSGTGGTGFPGLYSSNVQPVTFMTDSLGSGSWHVNVSAADLAAGGNTMSAWIKTSGATVLISDPFTVK